MGVKNQIKQKAVEPESHASLFNHALVIPCRKCEQVINKGLSVNCSLCEAHFCRSCTKIDKVIFDAISANQGTCISWFCESCQTVTGVQKLLEGLVILEHVKINLRIELKKLRKMLWHLIKLKKISRKK